MKTFNSKAYQRAIREGYRSGLEVAISADLKARGVKALYEPYKIAFEQPKKMRTYTPDWLLPNGIIVEGKGRFTTADRQKHLMIRVSNPDRDIRFVFSNSKAKIGKKSKTSYADWCRKNGFLYADKLVPEAWIREEK